MGTSPTLTAHRPLLSIERWSVSVTALWVSAVTCLGLGLRLAWVAYVDTIPLGGDPAWYYAVGQNLANGLGFVANVNGLGEPLQPGEPTAFWPPGYPFALAATFKLFGFGWTQAQVFNAICGALAIPLVYAIGARCFSRGVGITAAALYAVLPGAIAGLPVLFPAPMFVLLMLGAFYLLVAYPLDKGHAWPALIGFGALVGLAMLTRGQGAALLPIAALYWVGAAGWKAALRTAALVVVVVAAVITPWTVRNAVQMDAFVPIATSSGASLRIGHAPDATGTTPWTNDVIDGFYMWESLERTEWEVKGYREYTSRAISYAFTHPGHEIELTGLKVYHLYRGNSSTVDWLNTLGATSLGSPGFERTVRYLIDYPYYVLLFGALLATPVWLRRDPKRMLLVNTVIIWTLFHVAFKGEPRYLLPVYPVFVLSFAAGALALGHAASQAFRSRLYRISDHGPS